VFTAYYFIKLQKVVKIPSIQHENSLEITFQEKFKMFLKTMFSSSSESAATTLKADDSKLFIYLFILHSMHAAIKAMAVNRHIVKDVNI